MFLGDRLLAHVHVFYEAGVIWDVKGYLLPTKQLAIGFEIVLKFPNGIGNSQKDFQLFSVPFSLLTPYHI